VFHSTKNSRIETTWAAPVLTLLAIAGACGAAPAADATTRADHVSSAPDRGVDPNVKPGDDFFAYANGDWLKATAIPAGKNRYGARNEIEEKAKYQLSGLVKGAAMRPSGSYQRQVADFYGAYLNEDVIEAKGINPIKPLLLRIDDVHDKEALTRLLGSDLRADGDPLNFGVVESSHIFGLSVESGIHGEKNHFAYLVQGGLGLPDRDYYLNTSPQMQALRVKYQAYIGRALELAGLDHAAQRAEAVLRLETALARSHSTAEESGKEGNADNHWSRADFSNRAPGMDWSLFFAAAGLSKQTSFVAWQPGALTGTAALVASSPLDSWKDYLRFHVIHRYADVLPRAFAMPDFTIPGADVPVAPTPSPREQRAMDATSRALPDAVGRMYVEKYFPAETKAKVQTIVANVIDAFCKRVETAQWMTPATKKQALLKLKAMHYEVGYPEKWTDYSGLTIDAGDALGNLQRISDWNYRNALIKLTQPNDMREWVLPPQTVAAVFNPLQNGYNFAAALLQAPKFDRAASDAANYGAIGAIFGHEVSHSVDLLGAQYDAQGAAHQWWTDEDKARFGAASAALVDQFSAYRPFPDLSINGKLTLNENIADLGGLAASFDAYRRTLGSNAADKDYVRQQDRQFFIGFAREMRVKMRDDELRTRAATNDHAPENYRVSTVRNLDAWYDAFDVRPGQRLYLESKDRVRIW
jgi:predicted metalloendopeptidase